MKGGVLSSWIKEFATLVLIQTIQAFLFTIVIVLIVNTSQASADDNTKNSALGLIGIVGLASISKIEELVKKILGISSSVTDPSMKGGMSSLATGFAVANLVKNRVMTNSKKLAGGIKERQDNKKDIKKNSKARVKANENYDRLLRAAGVGTASSAGGYSSVNTDVGSGSIDESIRELEANNLSAGGNGSPVGSGTNKNGKDINLLKLEELRQAHQNRMGDLDDKLDELKKKRRDANKKIASSIVESTVAITLTPGAAALGAAKGEVDDIIKAAGIGAAAGDFIGEKATSLSFAVGGGAVDTAKKIRKNNETMKKELQDYMDKQTLRNGVTHSELKKAFRENKKETQRREAKSMEERRKAAEELIKNIKNVDGM